MSIKNKKESNFNIFSIFPTPIYKTNFNSKISKKQTNTIKKLQKISVKNSLNKITEYNKVLDLKEFKNLKRFIELHLQNFFKCYVSPKNNVKIYITESWLNFTNKGEKHHRHYHKNSIISGVFYFNCIENDSIEFVKWEKLAIDIETTNYNYFNSPTWIFPIKTMDLIMFPSKLDHQVQENKTNDCRISLAFNTFIEGDINNIFTIALKI